jgi:plasmid stabilization system protein ParE
VFRARHLAAVREAGDDVRGELRSVFVARHVVYYHVTNVAIAIVRVLDERRVIQVIFCE